MRRYAWLVVLAGCTAALAPGPEAAPDSAPLGADLGVSGLEFLDGDAGARVRQGRAAMPSSSGRVAIFTDSERSQLLRVYLHSHVEPPLVAEMELTRGYVSPDIRRLADTPEPFRTARGVELGMSEAEVRALLGPPTLEAGGRLEYVYDAQSWPQICERFAMPGYQSVYRFLGDELVYARWGFPHPLGEPCGTGARGGAAGAAEPRTLAPFDPAQKLD